MTAELKELQAALEDTVGLCKKLHGYTVYDYLGRGVGPALTKDLAVQVRRIENEMCRLQRETMGKEAAA